MLFHINWEWFQESIQTVWVKHSLTLLRGTITFQNLRNLYIRCGIHSLYYAYICITICTVQSTKSTEAVSSQTGRNAQSTSMFGMANLPGLVDFCTYVLRSFLSRVVSRTLTLATRRWNRELYNRSPTMAHFSPVQVATHAGVVACPNFHGDFLSEWKQW